MTRRGPGSALYELLSSMRFAVSLLTVLAIASVIGTVLKQAEPYQNYVSQFGPFWFPVFEALGLYDVYHAAWFLLILTFLAVSTGLCVYRNGPLMLREMRSNYAAWLHMRLIKGLRGPFLAWWAIVGLFVTLFAYLSVNMFLSGLHSYGTL